MSFTNLSKKTVRPFINGFVLLRQQVLACFCLLSFIQFLPIAAWAGDNQWTSLGPEGGWIGELIADPANPSTVYALTGSSVFKSVNSGAGWNLISTGLTGGFHGFAIDPKTPSTLYLLGEAGIYKSINGGTSWSHFNNGLPSLYHVYHTGALVVDPFNPSTLYTTVWVDTATGGETRVYKTIDGGGNWSLLPGTGLQKSGIENLFIDPSTPSTLYASSAYGILKSVDGGGGWSLANSGLPTSRLPTSGFIQNLIIDPSTPSTLYASTRYGVFKSINGGGNWTQSVTGLPSASSVNALAIDTLAPNTLYAMDGGLYKSMDGGGIWSLVNPGKANVSVNALTVARSNPSTLYFGTNNGVYKSIDGGLSSVQANVGLTATSFDSLVVDPTNPTTLYATGFDNGLLKSINGGVSWSPSNNGLSSNFVFAVVIDPTTPSTLYAISDSTLYKSMNGGLSWNAANNGLTGKHVMSLAINPLTPSILYAGVSGLGVYKSMDGGGSWNQSNTGLETANMSFVELIIDSTKPSTLYLFATGLNGPFGFSSQIYKSQDSGGNWSLINTTGLSAYIRMLSLDPTAPSTLFAIGDGGLLYKSTDGGATWNLSNTGLPSSSFVTTIAIDRSHVGTLYVGTNGNGVYKSTNSGGNWVPFNNGLSVMSVNSLAIDPINTSTLYAGTYGGGIYKISDTPPAGTSPVVTTGMVSAITPTSATLNGIVNPSGLATIAQFEYGLTTNYGSSVSVVLSPNNGSTPQNVSAVINGLQAGQVYHYRLTATNSLGTATGNDSQTSALLNITNPNPQGGTVICDICNINSYCAYQSVVTCTATPISNDYQFSGWGGACSGYGNVCTVTMDADKTVTANFDVFKKKHRPAWRKLLGLWPN